MTTVLTPNSTPLAALASDALRAMRASPDAAPAAADRFLASVPSLAATDAERAVAGCARAATRQVSEPTARRAREIAIGALAAGVPGPLGVALAEYGTRARAAAEWQEEACALGQPVLETIAARGERKERAVAGLALAVSARAPRGHTASVAQDAALRTIRRSPAEPVEGVLAAVARDVQDAAPDSTDAAALGSLLLSHIAGASPLISVRRIVQEARARAAAEARLDLAIRHQRAALDALAQVGPIPAAPAPEAAPEGTAADIVAALEERLLRHRAGAASVHAATDGDARRLRDVEAQRTAVADRITPLVEADRRALRLRELASLGTSAGLLSATIGGIALATPSAGPVGFLVVGTAVLGASLLARSRAQRRHEEILAAYAPLNDEHAALETRANGLRVRLELEHPVLRAWESAAQADQGQLDVIHLAEAASRAPTGGVEVGNDSLSIGGVSVPRKRTIGSSVP